VRGTCPEDVRAEQVEEKASALNSDDAFYLVTNKNDYLWFGKVFTATVLKIFYE
jgi:hypothetical protein